MLCFLFDINISIKKREVPTEKTLYSKSLNSKKNSEIPIKSSEKTLKKEDLICYVCENKIKDGDYIKISKSNSILCKKCLKKTI